jgi:type I restriction enzyme R subunit
MTIDLTLRDNVRAHFASEVRRILRLRGYPPDKQAQAVETVMKQAELLAAEWAA